MNPFWQYYGGKWRMAPKYPPPGPAIVEPFAGAAGYSTRYPDRYVSLYDKDPVICGIWDYLIRVSPDEVLSLPDVPLDGTVDDMGGVPQEARWLAGFWCNGATAAPRRRLSKWAKSSPESFWGPRVRERIARQVPRIRHWTITNAAYDQIPDQRATWFVDPPYQKMGKHYTHGASGIDFDHLAAWCRARTGPTIVCEGDGADWLPFEPFSMERNASAKLSPEVWWYKP